MTDGPDQTNIIELVRTHGLQDLVKRIAVVCDLLAQRELAMARLCGTGSDRAAYFANQAARFHNIIIEDEPKVAPVTTTSTKPKEEPIKQVVEDWPPYRPSRPTYQKMDFDSESMKSILKYPGWDDAEDL